MLYCWLVFLFCQRGHDDILCLGYSSFGIHSLVFFVKQGVGVIARRIIHRTNLSNENPGQIGHWRGGFSKKAVCWLRMFACL